MLDHSPLLAGARTDLRRSYLQPPDLEPRCGGSVPTPGSDLGTCMATHVEIIIMWRHVAGAWTTPPDLPNSFVSSVPTRSDLGRARGGTLPGRGRRRRTSRRPEALVVGAGEGVHSPPTSLVAGDVASPRPPRTCGSESGGRSGGFTREL